MNRYLLALLLLLSAGRAAADGPWISVGESGPVGIDTDGWTGDTRAFDVDGGTAIVLKGDAGWELRLDGALVSRGAESNRPCCIGFDGGPDGLPLDVTLLGRNALSGGIEAQNCSFLSIHGPGALALAATAPDAAAIASDGDLLVDGAMLSVIRSGTGPDDEAVVCGGDMSVTGSVVAVFADVPSEGGAAALRAGGDVTVARSAAILLGAGGIRAETVRLDGSFAGICTVGEAILAGDSAVAADTEALLLSEADAVSAPRLEFLDGNALSIVGNASGSGDHAAVRQTSEQDELVQSGGRTELFAPGGTGIAASGTLLVEGGELAVSSDPNRLEARSFFTADSVAGAAAEEVRALLGDEDAAAGLEAFFGDESVDAFLGLRAAPASGRPAAGVRADGVRFEGGATAVSCQTDAAGIVPASFASRTDGTVTVNGRAWTPPVRITFDPDGGVVEPGFALVPVGSAIGALPRPVRDGCVFLGWVTAKSAGSPVTAATKATAAATIYARWARESYGVAFHPVGGTGTMPEQRIAYGTTTNLSANGFSREGYVFMGWATTPGGPVVYRDQASVKNLRWDGRTVDLYVRWAKRDYRVSFDANGGTGRMAVQAMVYDRAAKLAANQFTRKNFVFAGWSRTRTGAVAFSNAQTVKNLNEFGGTAPLYARWAPQSYRIAFHPNGGSGSMSALPMKWGVSKALPVNAFRRDGFQFLGWALSAKDAAAQKVAYRNAATVGNLAALNGTFTLYAVWRKYVPKTAGRIRFALCQTPCGAFAAKDRIDKTFDWARRSLRGDEDVIVFPELAFAPFTELKTAWRQAPTVWSKASAFARERKAFVLVNNPFRPGGGSKMYNETRVFAPDGSFVGSYRKRVLARMDVNARFTPGPAATPILLPFARLGCLICKDAFTPSSGIKNYTGADLLLVQFAHPGVNNRKAPEAKGFPSVSTSMADLRRSRKGWLKLGKPYMAVNKYGPDGNYTLCGGTFAADKAGTIVNKADSGAKVVFVDYPLQTNGRISPTPRSAP